MLHHAIPLCVSELACIFNLRNGIAHAISLQASLTRLHAARTGVHLLALVEALLVFLISSFSFCNRLFIVSAADHGVTRRLKHRLVSARSYHR